MGTKRDRKLVERIAKEIMSWYESVEPDEVLSKFYDSFLNAARQQVKQLRSETLGRIASVGLGYHSRQGRTSLYQVHSCTWLDKYDSGREMLQEIAATVIVAKITDLICERGASDLPEAASF